MHSYLNPSPKQSHNAAFLCYHFSNAPNYTGGSQGEGRAVLSHGECSQQGTHTCWSGLSCSSIILLTLIKTTHHHNRLKWRVRPSAPTLSLRHIKLTSSSLFPALQVLHAGLPLSHSAQEITGQARGSQNLGWYLAAALPPKHPSWQAPAHPFRH